MRSYLVPALVRVMLITSAFVLVFTSSNARAQRSSEEISQQQAQQEPTPGPVKGRLTSTEGRINYPFAKVGDACNPFVDYNCEVDAAALKVAQEEMAKSGKCDPYVDYKCLDTYLGDNVLGRFFRYYKLEAGKASAPSDPDAPPSIRDGWPKPPQTIPPMPFADWPYGGTTNIGTSRPNSVDSPFMAAIANTAIGKWMHDAHIQMYGWINGGVNASTNDVRPGGNNPVGYVYTPNTVQLDQAVIYIERVPDTVQKDHIDWGFRLSALYGENYRYTNSYGLASYQFNGNNQVYGYDFPMVYGELYVPYVLEGLMFRLGRYISIPDIEAQLAPNNYTYTHSLTYTYDNYTNTGLMTTLAVTKNVMVQFGIDFGTETPVWNHGVTIPNPMPNALYPGTTMLKDPGNQFPSIAACIRLTSDSGNDTFYPCIDGINNGAWGYNNLQWKGFTYYHKFNEYWHLSFEAYWMSENGVPNLRNADAQAIFAGGGTPFSPQYVAFNPPNQAYCPDPNVLSCTVNAYAVLAYLNYSPDKMNNFTFRPEYYSDPNGWRTGTGVPTDYLDFTLGWQHWFSPQIQIRPEISYWKAYGGTPFNGGTKSDMFMFAMDLTIHF